MKGAKHKEKEGPKKRSKKEEEGFSSPHEAKEGSKKRHKKKEEDSSSAYKEEKSSRKRGKKEDDSSSSQQGASSEFQDFELWKQYKKIQELKKKAKARKKQ